MQDKYRDPIVFFTDQHIALAKSYAVGLQENFGNRTMPLSDKRDLVGALGQIAVALRLKGFNGIIYECFNPYVPRQKGDTGDGRLNGEIFDVKSKYIKDEKNLTNVLWDCMVLEEDQDDVVRKGIVNYIFVNVYLGNKPKAFIVGGISTMEFWRIARRKEKSDKLKMTGYAIKGIETKPFTNFVYHT